MKKLLATLAVITLVACGGATSEIKTDSTEVKADTTLVDSLKVDSVGKE